MGGGVVTGAGIGWAGWLGMLTGGHDVLGLVSLDPGTAIGVGMLCSVLGVRWAVGKWERAKKMWWDDWRRVGEGLGRDLKVNLDRTVDEKVVLVPESASKELLEMVKKREEEIGELEDELDRLEEDLRNVKTK